MFNYFILLISLLFSQVKINNEIYCTNSCKLYSRMILKVSERHRIKKKLYKITSKFYKYLIVTQKLKQTIGLVNKLNGTSDKRSGDRLLGQTSVKRFNKGSKVSKGQSTQRRHKEISHAHTATFVCNKLHNNIYLLLYYSNTSAGFIRLNIT